MSFCNSCVNFQICSGCNTFSLCLTIRVVNKSKTFLVYTAKHPTDSASRQSDINEADPLTSKTTITIYLRGRSVRRPRTGSITSLSHEGVSHSGQQH